MIDASLLQEYAELLVRTGMNLQEGQPLVVACQVENAPFARMVATEAYKLGCREVIMRWSDDFLTREKYLKAADAVFDETPAWLVEFFEEYDRHHAAYLALISPDPENLSGVDPVRLQRAAISSGKATRAHSKRQMSDEIPWCVAGVPSVKWAKKVFPDLSEEEAVDALWQAILKTVRVDGIHSAADAWEEHIKKLSSVAEKLNGYQFEKLHYENSLGTDLMVGLCKNHRWEGGCSKDGNGVRFVANMPTEEIFTSPKKDAVDGVVYASMPLCHHGSLIEELKFVLKEGKIVEATAKSGEEVLKKAITVDEGASYLGEAALVPYDSPISNLGILFYNTLYDENAACHFAFGQAYPCLQNASSMSEEEQREAGLNESDTHVDFMIGTKDLSVTGILPDGTRIPVMREGNFVI